MKPRRHCLILAAAAGLLAFAPGPSRAGDDQHEGQGNHRDARLVGYFIQWGIYRDPPTNYPVKRVLTSGSASRLTHIDYAFAKIGAREDGVLVCQSADSWADYTRPAPAEEDLDGVGESYDESKLRGNFSQLRKLKQRFPDLKVLMSIGGFTLSDKFSDAALTPESRTALAQSCVDMFINGKLPPVSGPGGQVVTDGAGVFDGIDIDWEWPGDCIAGCTSRPEDKENFTLLLQELRRQLDKAGRENKKRYQLTYFGPAGLFNLDHIEVKKTARIVDFISVQGYDLHGTWESTTNFQSNLLLCRDDPNQADAQLLNDDFVVNAYLTRGVREEKVVLGVPFYGRGWAGVPATNNGLFQSSAGAAPGEFGEFGVAGYGFLKNLLPTYGHFRDSSCKAEWLYSPTDRVFWTFDGKRVMGDKAEYADHRNLGGVIFWELTGDTPDGELVEALYRHLKD
jgi:chitinase